MAPHANDDPFDDLLTLEDTLYTTAHDQGVADGARAGRIEGRIFGLEKGFEKFAELGELHGRGAVWGSRLPLPKPATGADTTLSQGPIQATPASTSTSGPDPQISAQARLPPIANPSSRLVSNISLLYHLTDPPTFSTANTEVDVADFDDRVKRAGAKAKVIERIIGETSTTGVSSKDATSPEPGNGKGRNVRLEGEAARKGKKGDDNMEDFMGSRLIG
ncbi:hypothetical protein E8E12_000706 [Didymella heteroderae]|uniref:Essential protein Yae1 N-terminal domain-containing protein n=1 Tax=Didymella heteroderae TaxID=1769908 RepID=A0A9P5C0S7_9PLEO|nr:hypothetical protein E8E12_000706 [Didymella heteroderae]